VIPAERNVAEMLRSIARDRLALATMRERAERRARWQALWYWLCVAASGSLIMYVTAVR